MKILQPKYKPKGYWPGIASSKLPSKILCRGDNPSGNGLRIYRAHLCEVNNFKAD